MSLRAHFLAWASASVDGFYTGPSPDVLQLTVFILASLRVCKILCYGDSARILLMEGRLLSTLCWRGNSSMSVAAKVWLAAWLRRAGHLETKAFWRAAQSDLCYAKPSSASGAKMRVNR